MAAKAPVAASKAGPVKVQQPMTSVVARRVEPAKPSTPVQRILGAWPALVLLLACCVGLACNSTRWSSVSSGVVSPPPRPVPTTSLVSPASSSTKTAPKEVVATLEETLVNAADLPPEEETDLSLFPPQAWNHSSLIELPSALVPDSWFVDTGADPVGPLEVRRVFADPLLLSMDRFLTQAECDAIVDAAKRVGFERSMTTRGAVASRTSTSAFVPESDPAIRLLMHRVELVTGVPQANFELGPVIRYEPGQRFDEHWDSTRDETFGRRLTFFVPLASHPLEEAGHTAFPLLGVRFPPRNGSAILWRNFMPKSPYDDYDRRMKHAGEPPSRGLKYAVNIWVFKERYVHWSLRTPGSTPGVEFSPAALASGQVPQRPAPELHMDLLEAGERGVNMLTQATHALFNAQRPTGWLVHSDTGVLRVDRLYRGASDTLLVRVGDFLTLSERQTLLREGRSAGWSPSETIAGFTAARTSSTAFLYDRPIQEVVARRVAGMVGVPPEWVEANALNRYRVGEYYLPHFDSKADSVPGRRLTVHVTLNMEWDESRALIQFPALNMSVTQRAGQAVIWRNFPPGQQEHDPRVLHGFDAPIRGEVYTLTCFVFDHAIRQATLDQKGVQTTAAAAAASVPVVSADYRTPGVQEYPSNQLEPDAIGKLARHEPLY